MQWQCTRRERALFTRALNEKALERGGCVGGFHREVNERTSTRARERHKAEAKAEAKAKAKRKGSRTRSMRRISDGTAASGADGELD